MCQGVCTTLAMIICSSSVGLSRSPVTPTQVHDVRTSPEGVLCIQDAVWRTPGYQPYSLYSMSVTVALTFVLDRRVDKDSSLLSAV